MIQIITENRIAKALVKYKTFSVDVNFSKSATPEFYYKAGLVIDEFKFSKKEDIPKSIDIFEKSNFKRLKGKR